MGNRWAGSNQNLFRRKNKGTPMKKLHITIVILLLLSCSRSNLKFSSPVPPDGKYDTQFPLGNASDQIEEITRSVKKLTSIAYYKNYVFPPEARITRQDLQNRSFVDKAETVSFQSNSVIGTATIIFYQSRHVLLLTCAHVIDFPDTVLYFYPNESGQPSSFIQSIGIKIKQQNFVADLPDRGSLTILALDRKRDLALLGSFFSRTPDFPVPFFRYPFGRAKELQWGTFVYMIGYPRGFQMITRGIVSQPHRNKKGAFIVDAIFNLGFSGGIVLALRDGIPNFELVGIAGSTSAEFDYVLVPDKETRRSGYDPELPYNREIYVEQKKQINYGITNVIPVEEIVAFLKENEETLIREGYEYRHLLR